MSSSVPNPWGEKETQFFYQLTPEKILAAVESAGLLCTGRALALNSMENRVYEVEIILPADQKVASQSERFRVVKFYRPGRWSKEQILEEHEFLFDLQEYEIPVVAPLRFEDGSSLKEMPDTAILFAVFPKIGGRSPDELDDESLERIGRLLGRMHGVGKAKKALHRVTLNTETYGINNLTYLLQSNSIPVEYRKQYEDLVREICSICKPWFDSSELQRIHGDCHYGNLLWRTDGPFWVDFDDMVVGPPLQDLWLLIPGRDAESKSRFDLLLESYEQMSRFDRRSLRLFEPLRALRFIHFSAWIAKRWQDPAFPRTFPNFGGARYWSEQVNDLQTQLTLIRGVVNLC